MRLPRTKSAGAGADDANRPATACRESQRHPFRAMALIFCNVLTEAPNTVIIQPFQQVLVHSKSRNFGDAYPRADSEGQHDSDAIRQ